MRKEEEYVGRRIIELPLPGRRRVGKPKKRWKDNIKDDFKQKNIDTQQVHNRHQWRRLIQNSDPK